MPGSSKFQTYSSNRVTLGTNKEVRYVFSEGSFGALNWLDPKAQSNARVSENEYWTTLQDPLFGLDFMIDERFRPWLIEINTNPSLEICCPLLNRLIPTLIEDTLRF